MIYKAVFSAVLWLSECWDLTCSLRRKLTSWGSRTLGRAFGVPRHYVDEVGDHWRRLHRVGLNVSKKCGGDLSALQAQAVHRWAGHLARTKSGLLWMALRTRCLAWWRFFQHPRLPLHPKRFGRPRRWEGQLETKFGKAFVMMFSKKMQAEIFFTGQKWMETSMQVMEEPDAASRRRP